MTNQRRIRSEFSEPNPRRGATIVESAFVLSVLLTILLGMFDMGLAVMRQNTLTEAARLLARSAVVHGDLAGPQAGTWGAATITGTGAGSSPQAAIVRPLLLIMDPAAVSLSLVWLDGDNQPGHRIAATLNYRHQPIFPFVFGGPIDLTATSTMRISH